MPRVGENQPMIGISGQTPPLVMDEVVMMRTQPHEVVGSGRTAVLPEDDVVNLPNRA